MYAVADLFLNTRIHNYTWKMERLTRIYVVEFFLKYAHI